MYTTTTQQHGLFHRARVRLFGEKDPVARQLADIARQGAGMARLAHFSASLLLLLFSLGSLVALGGDALEHVLTGWQAGQVDIPAAIALAVSALLVAAMDVAALYAALMLRLLTTRRAPRSAYVIHAVVLIAACLLEGATYIYMSALYEHPVGVAWALIVGRALAAPFFSVYLSMARSLPITSRDILAQVELASGQGLIRDAVTISSDPSADLGEKAALFAASSVTTPEDAERLGALLRAIELRGIPVYVGMPSPPKLPTGGGSPVASTDEGSAPQHDSRREAVANGQVVHLPAHVSWRIGSSRRKRSARYARTVDNYENQARAAFASGARSKGKMIAATGMGPTAAASWVRTLKAEARAAENSQPISERGQVAL